MADKHIHQLVEATTMGNDDLLVLEQNNQAKKLSGKNLGDYVYAAAAEKIEEVEQAVADARDAVDDLIEDKDAITRSVAAMAELGTDDTLSSAGMAADAKATGDAIKNLIDITDTQPTSSRNEVWIQTSDDDLEIPEMADLQEVKDLIVELPDGDGDYILRQSNGSNTYAPLVIPTELPSAPAEDGVYTLQITVSSGTSSLAWVAVS